jgi:serine phosphatase RsbU (regulator of sigma subunit)
LKPIKQHIIILILLYLPFFGFTQVLDIQNYNTAEYLGRTNFNGFTQDDNLRLYFSTNEGIISYDGEKFNELTINEEIDSKPVGQLIYFNHSIYFSTGQHTFIFNPSNDSLYKLMNMPARAFEIHDDKLYFISEKSIYQINANYTSFKTIYTDDNDELTCFLINESITIAGTKNGLKIIKQGELKDAKGTFINVKAISAENDSSVFVLSDEALFNYSINKNIRDSKIIRKIVFKNKRPNQLFHSDNGNTYISTKNGQLYQYDGINDGDDLNTIGDKNGFNIFPIDYLNNDKESNLWILGERGLAKISINQPITILPEKNIKRIFTHENSVIVVKNREILSYNFSLQPTIFKISEDINTCSAIYLNQEWYITINDRYLYRIKRNTIQRELNSFELQFVQAINENAILAFNKENKLQVYDKQFQLINELEELDPNPKIIKRNSLTYVVSAGDVYQFDKEAKLTLTEIKIAGNLPLNSLRASNYGIWSFTDQTLKLHQIDGSISDFHSLFENEPELDHIYNLFEDSQNNLWVSLNKHLAKVNFSKEKSTISTNEINFFTKKDHVKNSYFETAVELENQQIWFKNDNSIFIYNPLVDNPNLVAPGIYIKSAYAINYDEFNDPKDTVELKESTSTISNKHEIIISPSIISHYQRHKSKLQYRNLAEGDNWINIPTDENIRLINLSDGENIIEIQAVNPNGITSKEIVSFSLIVNPPIWKRNWFYLSAILSVLLLGFVGYRSLNSFKDNKTRELNEKLDEKLEDLERRSHLQILKSERLKQLNELITSQKGELEKKNKQIESQKYELSLTNDQIKKQKDLIEETSNKLKSSINYAQRIQNALMSTEVEVKKAIDDSFIYFLPRDVVSGDFYWFNKVKNDKGEELLILAAVDCTGHGVPGAIVSVIGINLLNNITNLKKVYDPGQILNELNTDIINNLRQNETQVNDGMDMSLVTLNYHTKTVEFAGAKNPLIYVEDGELIRIRGDKHAIGGQQRGEERAFQTHIIKCDDQKKRTFFLFSDGYQDQFGGEKGFKFLTSNFKILLQEIHDLPVLEQKTILHERLEEWMADYSQTDDVLVIGLKF